MGESVSLLLYSIFLFLQVFPEVKLTPNIYNILFSAVELQQQHTTDDGTIDLSIMHKIVREMTGTLVVGSLQKQAINLQGNNNDSSQGNKGHSLLPIVINLTHSSIGWKKNASSPTMQESYTGGTSTSQLDMQSSLFTEERIQFQFLYQLFSYYACRGAEKL